MGVVESIEEYYTEPRRSLMSSHVIMRYDLLVFGRELCALLTVEILLYVYLRLVGLEPCCERILLSYGCKSES